MLSFTGWPLADQPPNLLSGDREAELMTIEKQNDLEDGPRLGHLYAKWGLSLNFFARAASLDRIGVCVLRVGLVIVLVWIGALKFADYEADSIVPLAANSPLMSFVYHHRPPNIGLI